MPEQKSIIKKQLSQIIGFFLLFILSFLSNAQTSNELFPIKKYTSRLELNLKGGNTRNIGRLGGIIPITETNRGLVFANIFGLLDSTKAKEGNFGLGYRHLYDTHILGGYIFYDHRKSGIGNLFNQITVGGEYLRENFEMRANVYVPIGKKEYSFTPRVTQLPNSNYVFVEKSVERGEKILHGFDVEVGGNLPGFKPLEGFISYYHFNSAGVKPIHGIRFRASLKLNEYISLEGEISHDRLRKEQTGKDVVLFGGIKLQYVFGKKKELSTRLEQKMTQMVVRDVDAITDVYGKASSEENIYIDSEGRVYKASEVDGYSEASKKAQEQFKQEEIQKNDPKRAIEVLRLDNKASFSDAKKAYKKFSLKYHPDKNSHLGEEKRSKRELKFHEVQNAFAVLTKEHSEGRWNDYFSAPNISDKLVPVSASSQTTAAYTSVFQATGQEVRGRIQGLAISYISGMEAEHTGFIDIASIQKHLIPIESYNVSGVPANVPEARLDILAEEYRWRVRAFRAPATNEIQEYGVQGLGIRGRGGMLRHSDTYSSSSSASASEYAPTESEGTALTPFSPQDTILLLMRHLAKTISTKLLDFHQSIDLNTFESDLSSIFLTAAKENNRALYIATPEDWQKESRQLIVSLLSTPFIKQLFITFDQEKERWEQFLAEEIRSLDSQCQRLDNTKRKPFLEKKGALKNAARYPAAEIAEVDKKLEQMVAKDMAGIEAIYLRLFEIRKLVLQKEMGLDIKQALYKAVRQAVFKCFLAIKKAHGYDWEPLAWDMDSFQFNTQTPAMWITELQKTFGARYFERFFSLKKDLFEAKTEAAIEKISSYLAPILVPEQRFSDEPVYKERVDFEQARRLAIKIGSGDQGTFYKRNDFITSWANQIFISISLLNGLISPSQPPLELPQIPLAQQQKIRELLCSGKKIMFGGYNRYGPHNHSSDTILFMLKAAETLYLCLCNNMHIPFATKSFIVELPYMSEEQAQSSETFTEKVVALIKKAAAPISDKDIIGIMNPNSVASNVGIGSGPPVGKLSPTIIDKVLYEIELEEQEDSSFTAEEAASFALDMLPLVGTGKSLVQLATGYDAITGEEVSRWLECTGLMLGVIPFGKGPIKAKNASKAAKKIIKSLSGSQKAVRISKKAIQELLSASPIKQLEFSGIQHSALLRFLLNKPPTTALVAHHIVPLEALKAFPALMKKAANGGFKISGENNGIIVDAISHRIKEGHAFYNGVLLGELEKIAAQIKHLKPEQLAQEVQKVSNAIRKKILDGSFAPPWVK